MKIEHNKTELYFNPDNIENYKPFPICLSKDFTITAYIKKEDYKKNMRNNNMKIEYKENLYLKYLKQRYMALCGWVQTNKEDKEDFIQYYQSEIKKLNSIKDVNILENMIQDYKKAWSISEEEAKKILKL